MRRTKEAQKEVRMEEKEVTSVEDVETVVREEARGGLDLQQLWELITEDSKKQKEEFTENSRKQNETLSQNLLKQMEEQNKQTKEDLKSIKEDHRQTNEKIGSIKEDNLSLIHI